MSIYLYRSGEKLVAAAAWDRPSAIRRTALPGVG